MRARIWFALSLILFSLNANALDNEITVLAVYAPGAYAMGEKGNSAHHRQLDGLVAAWSGSDISPLVSLRLLNTKVGSTYKIETLKGLALTSTTYHTTYTAVNSGSYNLAALRDKAGADLVVVFAPAVSLNACGYARQANWTNEFGTRTGYVSGRNLAAPLLDLRASEDYFVALLSTNFLCTNMDATQGEVQGHHIAHEIGHLFGAGHETVNAAPGYKAPPPSNYYLYSDTRAAVEVKFVGPLKLPLIVEKSVMSRPNILIGACASDSSGKCRLKTEYSDASGFGDSLHDNVKAIEKTALSIANYRPIPTEPIPTEPPPPPIAPPPPPTCGLSKPHNVHGSLLQACDTNNDVTWHTLAWDDSCPAESDYYEVFYSSKGSVGPWTYSGSLTPRSVAIWNRVPLWWRVQACEWGGRCSGLSKSYYFTPMLCWTGRKPGPVSIK